MRIDLLSRAQLSIINKNSLRYPLAIAEKDYFLAIVLQIIYSSKLKDSLVFKGGTAIHHLYLDQLRFSEDLDFQTTGKITEDDLREVFEPYEFLEILKSYKSDFTLKIQRLKFSGPLGQPNSIKLDVDLTQELILPVEKEEYKNVYGVHVTVSAMAVKEICAEKVRAVNERARYRDFYDLAMIMKTNGFGSNEILEILKKKELRNPLSKESILENLEIAEEARSSGAESLYYREEISEGEMNETLDRLLALV
ncbi:MAG: nucleotidyl transferase AbiEii/AbiGii toxin family protein [Thermoleophilia bacterium]